jgi:SAM-dependent methyltransferase
MSTGYRAPDETAELERKRLQYLGALFDEPTISRLRRLEVRPGWRCLEIGAGSGSVARALAALVAPDGEVLATDVDDRFLVGDEIHLEFRVHDVTRDPLPDDHFDLAHARGVFHSLRERVHALDVMIAATRPGGLVVIEDPDWSVFDSQPLPPAFALLHRASQDAYAAAVGYDKNLGSRLPRMLHEAGLVDIDAEGSVFMMHGGTPSTEWYVLGLERSMASLVEAGIVDAPTGAAALAEVRDRNCRLLSPLRVTAWGRKPR